MEKPADFRVGAHQRLGPEARLAIRRAERLQGLAADLFEALDNPSVWGGGSLDVIAGALTAQFFVTRHFTGRSSKPGPAIAVHASRMTNGYPAARSVAYSLAGVRLRSIPPQKWTSYVGPSCCAFFHSFSDRKKMTSSSRLPLTSMCRTRVAARSSTSQPSESESRATHRIADGSRLWLRSICTVYISARFPTALRSAAP